MPRFKIYHTDYLGDAPKQLTAVSDYEAALNYAVYYNSSADYTLLKDSEEITVENERGEKVKYRISAEPSIVYCADEIQ